MRARYFAALFRQKNRIEFIYDLSFYAEYFDGFRLLPGKECYEACGWARHPAKGTARNDILLIDQNHNWLGHAIVN